MKITNDLLFDADAWYINRVMCLIPQWTAHALNCSIWGRSGDRKNCQHSFDSCDEVERFIIETHGNTPEVMNGVSISLDHGKQNNRPNRIESKSNSVKSKRTISEERLFLIWSSYVSRWLNYGSQVAKKRATNICLHARSN